MTDDRSLVNLNSADVETLLRLPGVGPKLAQRIFAARPFTSVDDLQRVDGVGPAFLERLRPLLEIADAAETEQGATGQIPTPETKREPPEMELQAPPEPQPAAEIAPLVDEARAVPLQEPAPASRLRLLWMVFGSGLVAAILALALSLGVLANLNDGSLNFVTNSQFKSLTREVDELGTRLDTLTQDVAGLRARLDNLEALSQNVSTINELVEQLQKDVKTAAAQVQTLQQQSERFQDFLDGLRDLMDNVFPGEEKK